MAVLEEVKETSVSRDILSLLAPTEDVLWAEWFGQIVRGALAAEKRRIASQVRIEHWLKQVKNNAHRPHVQVALQALIEEEEKSLAQFAKLEEKLDGLIASEVVKHPAWPWLSRVKGIGKENIAKVVGQIDIHKAPYVSCLYRYAGYDVDKEGKGRKRQKMEEGFNGTLRTMCYRVGESLMKARGAYYQFYLKAKEQEVAKLTAQGYKIVPSRSLPSRNGKKYEPPGMISEGHVHMRALRKMIKLFLSHLWQVWREAEGLPAPKPYPISKLMHPHYYDPEEFAEK